MSSGFRFGLFGYLLCALLVAAMCAALFETNRRVEASWKLIAGDVAMLEALSRFGQESSAAAAAHRGWALSRAGSLRLERGDALADARVALGDLRRLAKGDRRMDAWLDQLGSLLQRREDVMIRSDDMRRFGEPPAPMTKAIASAAREADHNLAGLRDTMRLSVLSDLEMRREDQRDASQLAKRVVLSAVTAMLVILFPLYFVLLREAKARERAEAWLRDVTESVPAAVFRLRRGRDNAMQFEFVSKNAYEIRGVSREALMQDHRAAITSVMDEDRPAIAGALLKACARLESYEKQYRIRHADGRIRWVLSTARPRAEPDGSVLWHGYWVDVTCQRELERQLVDAKERAERANRAKSDFLAAMSHEIRTPMTGVMGMVELLALDDLREEQRMSVAVIRESSAALLRITDDILDWSRIEAGKLELRLAPGRLDEIVARVADLYAAAAANKGLRLERWIDPALSACHTVDAVRVQQVLSNLVSNAIKFTNRGEILISVALLGRAAGKEVVAFDVSDTGTGLSAEEQSRLFAPYSQAGDAMIRSQGCGLGLSISRRLAELMGGSLRMQSALGVGTRVRLVLPAPPAPKCAEAHAAAGAAPPKADHFRSARVLLVDDDQVTRLVMQRQLALLGYVAETAASGAEALKRCAETRFDVVLVDCNMSSMDGYEFARRFRAGELEAGSALTPIIACTARAFDGDAAASREAGMDDHLRKPADLAQLDSMVRRWAVHPRAGANRA